MVAIKFFWTKIKETERNKSVGNWMYALYNLSICFVYLHLYYQYFNTYFFKLYASNIDRAGNQSEVSLGQRGRPIDMSLYESDPNLLSIKVSANLFFSIYLAIFIQNELKLIKLHRSIRGLLIMSVIFFCVAVFIFGIKN